MDCVWVGDTFCTRIPPVWCATQLVVVCHLCNAALLIHHVCRTTTSQCHPSRPVRLSHYLRLSVGPTHAPTPYELILFDCIIVKLKLPPHCMPFLVYSFPGGPWIQLICWCIEELCWYLSHSISPKNLTQCVGEKQWRMLTLSVDAMVSQRWPSRQYIAKFVINCLHLSSHTLAALINVARLINTDVSNLSSSPTISCCPELPTDKYLSFSENKFLVLTTYFAYLWYSSGVFSFQPSLSLNMFTAEKNTVFQNSSFAKQAHCDDVLMNKSWWRNLLLSCDGNMFVTVLGDDLTSHRSFPTSSSSLDEVYEETEEANGVILSPHDKTGDLSIVNSLSLGFLFVNGTVFKQTRQLRRSRITADVRWQCGFLEKSLSMFLTIDLATCSNLLNTMLLTSYTDTHTRIKFFTYPNTMQWMVTIPVALCSIALPMLHNHREGLSQSTEAVRFGRNH